MLKVRERDIENAVCDILQLDGWRCFKMEQNFSERKRKVVGEAGMPDRLFIRYTCEYPEQLTFPIILADQVMWIEFKRPRRHVTMVQKLWHAAERKRGALTLIAGVDFPASVDGFMEWYRNSHLMRKRM